MTLSIAPTTTVENKSSAAAMRQFLAFRLGAQHFAVEILRVLEIRELSPITPIPNAPSYVRGVMNLRGAIVPVVDLRMRFGVGDVIYNDFTVIIVVSVGARYVGLVVDAMSNVIEVSASEIAPPTELSMQVDLANLAGIIRHEGDIILALNLENLLAFEVIAEA